MKRFILSLLIPMVMAVSAGAMSYEEARQRAWFLTDKMGKYQAERTHLMGRKK